MAETRTQAKYATVDPASAVQLLAFHLHKISFDKFVKASKPSQVPGSPQPRLFLAVSSFIKGIPDEEIRLLAPLAKGKHSIIVDGDHASICGSFVEPSRKDMLKKHVTDLVQQIDRKIEEALVKDSIPSLFGIATVEKTAVEQLVADQMASRNLKRPQEIFPGMEIHHTWIDAELTTTFPETGAMIRLLNAIEEIPRDNIKDRLKHAAERAIRHKFKNDRDAADEAVAEFHNLCDRKDSDSTGIDTISRIIKDYGMGRVEREACLLVLEAVRDALQGRNQWNLVDSYVRAIRSLSSIGLEDGWADDALALELGPFGVGEKFDFRNEMSLASAYDSLPIRFKPSGFIRDEVDLVNKSQVISKTYHAVLNGMVNHQSGAMYPSVFDYRIEQISQAIAENRSTEQIRSKARIAMRNLVTLWMCIPNRKIETPEARFQALKNLIGQGTAGIKRALEELNARRGYIQTLVEILTVALKERKELFSAINQTPVMLYFCVRKSILDRNGMAEGTPFLKYRDADDEPALYLKHMDVSREVPGGMFESIPVKVKVSESWIKQKNGGQIEFRSQKAVPERLLYCLMYPEIKLPTTSKEETERLTGHLKNWWAKNGGGIYIAHNAELFEAPSAENRDKEAVKSLSAIRAVLNEILLFATLRRIAQHIRRQLSRPEAILLRLQKTNGQSETANYGDASLYAQVKTVEHALGDTLSISSQGFVLAGDNSEKYRKTASAWGVLSDLPTIIHLPAEPALKKIAVVAFTGRPCDRRVGKSGPLVSGDDGHVLFGEVITFVQKGNGYVVKNTRRFARADKLEFNLGIMRTIERELDQLSKDGFSKILCIAREFHSPKFGLTDDERRPYLTPEIFDEIVKNLPNCDVYPLVKGTYDGVKVGKLESHQTLFIEGGQEPPDKRFHVIPVLTVANLRHVGGTGGTRTAGTHSSCTTYYVATGAYSENARSIRLANDLLSPSPVRESLLSALKALHCVRYEKEPEQLKSRNKMVAGSKLDPFEALTGDTNVGLHSERIKLPVSRRKSVTISMLPVLQLIGDVVDIVPIKKPL